MIPIVLPSGSQPCQNFRTLTRRQLVAMTTVQLFLSAVTEEFRSYRDALRTRLHRPNVAVQVQETFIATGTETLDKLDLYIKGCDAIIHLVGSRTGAFPPPNAIQELKARYPDIESRLPFLVKSFEIGLSAISYTQWEAYFALYHRKALVIAAAAPEAPRDATFPPDPVQQAAQEVHLDRLRQLGHHAEITFANLHQLVADVSLSTILDLLAKADARSKRYAFLFNPTTRRFVAKIGYMIGGSIVALLVLTLGVALHFWVTERSLESAVGQFGTVAIHVVVFCAGAIAGLVCEARARKKRANADSIAAN